MHDEAAVIQQRPRAVGRALDVIGLRAAAQTALLLDLVDYGIDLTVVRRRADDEVLGDADQVADCCTMISVAFFSLAACAAMMAHSRGA